MALTVIDGARCRARWRVSWWTAAFDDEYEYDSRTGHVDAVDRPDVDDPGRHRPGVDAASSRGRKNLVVWNTPWTLRLRTRSHEAVSCSTSGAPQVAPALFTRTWTPVALGGDRLGEGPRAPSSVERSAARPRHDPYADSSATVASTASALREAMTTSAPPATKPAGDHPADAPRAAGDHDGLAGDGEELVGGGGGGGARSWEGTVPHAGRIGNVRTHGSPAVHLALTDEQLELQATLRAYFADLAASTSVDGGPARTT